MELHYHVLYIPVSPRIPRSPFPRFKEQLVIVTYCDRCGKDLSDQGPNPTAPQYHLSRMDVSQLPPAQRHQGAYPTGGLDPANEFDLCQTCNSDFETFMDGGAIDPMQYVDEEGNPVRDDFELGEPDATLADLSEVPIPDDQLPQTTEQPGTAETVPTDE
jgi:hypothetical protein